MDHETASRIRASERYVIGDLSSPERDQFEEHFADCPRCMDEVWMASAFAANARAVFRDRAVAQAPSPAEPAGRGRRGWLPFRWQVAIPAFAAAALAAVAVYQAAVTIPALRAPQSLIGAVVLDGATRAALPQVPASGPLRFQLALGTPSGVPAGPGAESGRAWVELTGGSPDRVWSSGWVRIPPANEPLDIYFPIRLAPGRYTIVVRAEQAGGAELARDRFEVTAQGASTP